MAGYSSGAEYQSGPGHSRATVAIEDTLLRLGIPLDKINHNREQIPGVSPLKPDISYQDPTTGQFVNIEIDTNDDAWRDRNRQLRAYDRNSRNIHVTIDPRTGAVKRTRVFDPLTNRRVRMTVGPRMSDLVAGKSRTRVRTDPHFTLRAVTAPPRRPAAKRRRARPAAPPGQPVARPRRARPAVRR